MRFLVVKKKTLFIFITISITLLSLFIFYTIRVSKPASMVMGGRLYLKSMENSNEDLYYEKSDVEKYFRPSKLPVLNNRGIKLEYTDYYEKDRREIALQDSLFITPEDAILNYYSVLREAANHEEGKHAGCGSIGDEKQPYPVAYQFLSDAYQDQLSFEKYLQTFENILHINLVKLREVPVYEEQLDIHRYFVEIEAIEGSDKDVAYFAYYYGFIDMIREESNYKIAKMEYYGETYLCAPYHSWFYIAEAVVEIKYGGWCSLVEKMYPTQQTDYVKYIYFDGTDGKEYLIVFFQLTNDYDIEIAQYRKGEDGEWKLIKLNPEKCIENK